MVEEEVREVSKQFYAALNQMLGGDANALIELWAHTPDATTMHPIGGREVGWENIKASFERVARSSAGGYVEMTDRLIRIHGDTAYEVGIEHAEFEVAGTPLTVNSRVTNIFYCINGAWKIIHHHGDMSPGIAEALDKAD
ncbi:MAG: nuclear transport factor 2 family protein [Pseudomonadota bacterium]